MGGPRARGRTTGHSSHPCRTAHSQRTKRYSAQTKKALCSLCLTAAHLYSSPLTLTTLPAGRDGAHHFICSPHHSPVPTSSAHPPPLAIKPTASFTGSPLCKRKRLLAGHGVSWMSSDQDGERGEKRLPLEHRDGIG